MIIQSKNVDHGRIKSRRALPANTAGSGLGLNAVAVLDGNGNVWTWGTGASGQLGNNSTAIFSYPVTVAG